MSGRECERRVHGGVGVLAAPPCRNECTRRSGAVPPACFAKARMEARHEYARIRVAAIRLASPMRAGSQRYRRMKLHRVAGARRRRS